MKNEEVVEIVVKAVDEQVGGVSARLDKINGKIEEHGRWLAKHDTEIALLQKEGGGKASNPDDDDAALRIFKEVVRDLILIIAALVGAKIVGLQ